MDPTIRRRWILGYAVGLPVVAAVVVLLLWIIALARRIARQADDIVEALDGARAHTAPLFDVSHTNQAVESITRDLRRLRLGERA